MLRELAETERSFFLLVHYFDPHYDYVRHPRFNFAAERSGRLDGTQGISELQSLADLTPDEIAFLRDLYDEEVRHTDAGVGRLLDTLRELGLYDDALIIVTADHGEEFLERGWIGHTRSLYDELVRVPLIVRPPGGPPAPQVVDALVSLVSLAPTVLDYAGIDLRRFDRLSVALFALPTTDDLDPEVIGTVPTKAARGADCAPVALPRGVQTLRAPASTIGIDDPAGHFKNRDSGRVMVIPRPGRVPLVTIDSDRIGSTDAASLVE